MRTKEAVEIDDDLLKLCVFIFKEYRKVNNNNNFRYVDDTVFKKNPKTITKSKRGKESLKKLWKTSKILTMRKI